MAKNSGNDNFNGSIGDKTYYIHKDAGPIVRERQGPSKQKMEANPKYAITLRNSKELGGGSTAAKAIRLGLGHLCKEFQDSSMSGRLSSAVRKVLTPDKTNPKERPLNIATNPSKIKQFQLSKAINFDNVYAVKPISTINDQRTAVSVIINTTSKHHHIKTPKSATHFRLTAALSLVSNHKYDTKLKQYKPSNPQQNGLGTLIDSEFYAIDQTYNNITLTLNTPNQQPLAPDVTATIWLGIIYYKLEQNKFVSLHTQKAMKCLATF